MILAIAISALFLSVVAALTWTVRLLQVATLLAALDPGDARALSVLCQWSNAGAAVVALRQGPELERRRRQSLERIHATLLDEGNPAG